MSFRFINPFTNDELWRIRWQPMDARSTLSLGELHRYYCEIKNEWSCSLTWTDAEGTTHQSYITGNRNIRVQDSPAIPCGREETVVLYVVMNAAEK